MNFLYPSVLWALSLIAIPVIIHLFNFRVYKIAYFSNIRFLSNIKNASESKSKIKNLILLILRILAITVLVFAFAMPYKPVLQNHAGEGRSIVCIYIDNSFSMNSAGTYGNLIDASKERARKIVNSYANTQKFLILTNDFEPGHRNLVSKEQAVSFINQCQASPSLRTLSEILNDQQKVLNTDYPYANHRQISYLISDFQKIISDFEKFPADTSAYIYLLPMATNKFNNIYIDSCWFASSGRIINKQEELIVRLVNKGNEPYSDIPVKLFINGRQKAVSSFNIDSDQTIEIPINYSNTESGNLACYLEIADYPILYDNKLYFSYHINKKTSILVIHNKTENEFIKALFQNDSSFIVHQTTYGKIKTSEFGIHHVIILDEPELISTGLSEELKKFVSQGGVLLIMPGGASTPESINSLLSSMNGSGFSSYEMQATEIEKINYEHFIYKDVFIKPKEKLKLPALKSYFSYQAGKQHIYSVLLSSSSGKPMLVQHNFENGKVYLFCFPLSPEYSDFVMHPLFVPTLYNIAAYSQTDDVLFYTLGKDRLVELKLKNRTTPQAIHITNQEKSTDFIPFYIGIGELGMRFDLKDNILNADNYYLTEGDSVLKGISYNFDRKESDPDFYTVAELRALIEEFNLKATTRILPADMSGLELELEDLRNERKDFWKIFILFALIFVLGEILVIRLWPEQSISKGHKG